MDKIYNMQHFHDLISELEFFFYLCENCVLLSPAHTLMVLVEKQFTIMHLLPLIVLYLWNTPVGWHADLVALVYIEKLPPVPSIVQGLLLCIKDPRGLPQSCH